MKRGFQLSIGMMVILIITLIIFIGSIYFIRQFYTATEEFRKDIDENTESQLRALIRDGSIVAVPINKATLKRGSGESFWIGIQNILKEQRDFGVKVQFTGAFDQEEIPIDEVVDQYIDENWVIYSSGPHTIQNNEFESVLVGIVVGETVDGNFKTPDGIYSFNVCVWDWTTHGSDIDICDRGSDQLYPPNKVFKIFVEVD